MSSHIRSSIDLLAVIAIALVSVPLFWTGTLPQILSVLLGFLIVIVLPGYAFVSALYPESTKRDDNRLGGGNEPTISNGERFLIAIVTSIGIVPGILLIIEFSHINIARTPVIIAITSWTVLFSIIALVGRFRLPPARRFVLGGSSTGGGLSSKFTIYRGFSRSDNPFNPRSKAGLMLNVMIVFAIVFLGISIAYAAVAPPSGDDFSELYLLTENETGELVNEGFQTEHNAGESITLTIAIGNQLGESTEYSVIVLLQEIPEGEQTPIEETELDRFDQLVMDEETVTNTRTWEPDMTGDQLRLLVLLYEGQPVGEPAAETADEYVYLWISIE